MPRRSSHGCSVGQRWSNARQTCYQPSHSRGRPRGCSYTRRNGRCLSRRAYESRSRSFERRRKRSSASRIQSAFRSRGRAAPGPGPDLRSPAALKIQSAMRRLSAKRRRSRTYDAIPHYAKLKSALGKASNNTKFKTPHGIYMKVSKTEDPKGFKKLS